MSSIRSVNDIENISLVLEKSVLPDNMVLLLDKSLLCSPYCIVYCSGVYAILDTIHIIVAPLYRILTAVTLIGLLGDEGPVDRKREIVTREGYNCEEVIRNSHYRKKGDSYCKR